MALDEILAHKRIEVAAREQAHPLASFQAALSPSDRSLERALRRPRTGFILECKRASPSQGEIRGDLDLDTVASAYGPHADAISVLTDERFFGGSFEHLRSLRQRVHQPVLCKDFILGPYQVYEARKHGADAVLLMLSVLSDHEYRDCHAAATSLDVDVVTEVHTEQELARAQTLEARIIGINNRDLTTLAVDLGVTERLAPRLKGSEVVIAESGIGSHRDVQRLRPLVDGFLVGTSLMRQADLGHATRELVFGTTKICGLTLPEDAVSAHALGATHGGMIFAGESPRCIAPHAASRLRQAAPLQWVGVFVNVGVEQVAAIAESLDLAAVQLHGEESIEEIRALRERFAGRREVWKAIRVMNSVPRVAETGADRLVLDAHSSGARGGTGRRFNWALVNDHPDLHRMLLGGGLAPQSVPAAVAVGTWGLDVNSGVERSPGRKDPAKLAALFEARRGHGRDRRRVR
ncbi:MAG TPA: bifunctional indole-3-glycerol-phosphate synthase TrpC/phosphoribosylanthranilate isomerase TrpF [Gemmatimonadales bacterium]|nr:bifunctional indole-3-glycerol-phosphate synthase TrpC/phosphoribosylanthranilate isomerase TrpF [Gemmatimonadales bacterium]